MFRARPGSPADSRHRPVPERPASDRRVSLGPTGKAALIAAALAVPLMPLALGHGLGASPEGTTATADVSGVAGPGAVPIASSARVVPAAGAAKKRPVAPPTQLLVPSIGIDAGTPEPLGIDAAGRLGAPVDFNKIGWFAQGPKPGEAGPAVIVGHVDSFRGPAVFFRLRELQPGAQITIKRTDGWRTTFTVDAVKTYPKDAFPSEEVYGPTANAQLRLITCGGTFDRDVRSYEDNVVVFASVH